MKSGVKFSWEDNEGYMNYMRPTTAEDISNPNVPLSAIMQDNSPAAVQARLRFGAPPVDRWETDRQPCRMPQPGSSRQPNRRQPHRHRYPFGRTPTMGNPVNESYSDTLRSMEPEDPAARRWTGGKPTSNRAECTLSAVCPAACILSKLLPELSDGIWNPL